MTTDELRAALARAEASGESLLVPELRPFVISPTAVLDARRTGTQWSEGWSPLVKLDALAREWTYGAWNRAHDAGLREAYRQIPSDAERIAARNAAFAPLQAEGDRIFGAVLREIVAETGMPYPLFCQAVAIDHPGYEIQLHEWQETVLTFWALMRPPVHVGERLYTEAQIEAAFRGSDEENEASTRDSWEQFRGHLRAGPVAAFKAGEPR